MRKTILFLAALAISASVNAQNNIVKNGDFETGDLSNWTAVDNGNGTIGVYSGSITAQSGATIPAPPSGSFASLVDQTGPGSHILYQNVKIPTDGLSYVFSATVYYNNQANDFVDGGSLDFTGGANQQFRIDIMDPSAPVDDVGAGVLLNVLKTEPGDQLQFGYAVVTTDLSQFAGQTVRIRFAEVDNVFFFNVGFDDVRVIVQRMVPVNEPWAIAALFLALLGLGVYGVRRFY